MNKYIKNIAVSALCMASFSLVSCDDFLTETPQSQYTADTFYQIQNDFELAIAGVYAQQQGIYGGLAGVFRAAITRCDETIVTEGDNYVNANDRFIDDATSSAFQSLWSSLYNMIYRTNILLERMEGVEFKDAQVRDNIKGEALALRAWAYYTLGTHFGGVPLIDRVLTTAETKEVARASQAETFAFAETDYKDAISLLPAEWTGKNLGRVTKYAAMGGLARLYMFQSNFSAAAPYLKDIIGSGKYQMAANYEDCFNDAFDNTQERVWEIQYMNGGLGEGNIIPNSCLPAGYKGDLMPFSGASAALRVSTDMVNAYEEGDLRKEVSVIDGADIMVGSSNRAGEWYITKWLHYTAEPVNQDDFAQNLPVIRYTDVILMYAECLNEAGYNANGEAFNLINSVRERAGLAPLTAATTPDQTAFRKAIMQERRVEFAFEGMRWWDLIRWNNVVQVMDDFLKADENQNGTFKMGSDNRKIYAIPAQEIANYNDESVLWQNPGY